MSISNTKQKNIKLDQTNLFNDLEAFAWNIADYIAQDSPYYIRDAKLRARVRQLGDLANKILTDYDREI